MRKGLFLLLVFFATSVHGEIRRIRGVESREDTAAINYNFRQLDEELRNTVHRTSTETIRGYKYFVNPVDFVTVVVDTATISHGDFQTIYVDTITAAYSVYMATVGGNVGIGTTSPLSNFSLTTESGITIGTNDFSSSWNFDQGGIHMEMPFEKDEASSGGSGSIKIFSNNTHDETLQGTMALVTSATPGLRRLKLEAIEQNVAFRNMTLNENGGNIGIGISQPARLIHAVSTATSTGYIEMLRLEGQTLSNGWERGIAFTGNSGAVEVGRVSGFLTGTERHLRFYTNGTQQAAFDNNSTAGNTRFLIYDVDNGTIERVSVGAADSCGAGFKCLRIPN